uniref:Uncharacterized protein n=1 Tax=Aegilops tauschii subsp. strangulata TaxID=200361 RepID=A0A453E2H4_AEGTS
MKASWEMVDDCSCGPWLVRNGLYLGHQQSGALNVKARLHREFGNDALLHLFEV